MNEKIKVLDVPINNYTAKEAMQKVIEYMHTEPVNIVEMVTMNMLSQFSGDEEKKVCIDEFDLTFAGSKAILEAAGITETQYLKEADTQMFVKMFMRYLHKNHSKIFLLAENEETLVKLKKYITSRYSGITIIETGTMEEHGKSDDMMVNRMNGVEPDCILSTLPSPLQEEFILRNKLLLNAKIWFGIGNGLKQEHRIRFNRKGIRMFLEQHIVKKRIEKERKHKQNL